MSTFQRFTTAEVERSSLRNAPYNPRQITDEARRRLRETMERVGLVAPVVWNKRTGNIVSGHQRIRQLDALEKGTNYRLTVAVVDVEDAKERELNILLNNAEVTGDWDLEKLEEVLAFDGLEVLSTGFDDADLLRLFDSGMAGAEKERHEVIAGQIATIHGAYERLNEATAEADDDDFYAVLVFKNHAERLAFTQGLGLNDDNRYVDGRMVTKLLGELRDKESKLPGASAEPEADGAGQDPADGAAKPR